MSRFASRLYAGTVVHKRLMPKQHAFSYRVFALCLDVDEIDHLHRELKLFSRNRGNLLGFRDRDLGEASGLPVGDKARAVLRASGLERFGARIELVCYPRVMGYVFNPLSVYFCRDKQEQIGAIIYEVTNTFGERKSYVIEAQGSEAAAFAQSCAKELYVSPYTGRTGTYSFHTIAPAERVLIGVALREEGQPVLKTHFRGERVELSDSAIVGMLARHPLMTLKVISAIHVEAARLWAKGVPLVPRHTSPAYSFTVIRSGPQESAHA